MAQSLPWAPKDTNALIIDRTVYYLDSISQVESTRGLPRGTYRGWSIDGTRLTGTDEEGIFVMEVDGSNKIHIQP